MKKLFLGLLAGVAMLFTACQDEEVKAVVDGDTTVSITAQLPTGVSTRAYADGTTATKLTYAIGNLIDGMFYGLLFSASTESSCSTCVSAS